MPLKLISLLAIGHSPAVKPAPIEATLTVRGASFCWARPHSNLPERSPAAAIKLRLDLVVSYRNPGAVAVVVPRQHEQIPFVGNSPEQLTKARQAINLFTPKGMRTLANTSDGEFDSSFAVISPGGEMSPMLAEAVELTVYNPSAPGSKDWRGGPLFVSLEQTQQPVTPRVAAAANAHGSFWTGKLRTSTVEITIPSSPGVSGECR